MATRDAIRALRRSDADLTGHTWRTTTWRYQRALVCDRCGYLWKPTMLRPSKDCPA